MRRHVFDSLTLPILSATATLSTSEVGAMQYWPAVTALSMVSSLVSLLRSSLFSDIIWFLVALRCSFSSEPCLFHSVHL